MPPWTMPPTGRRTAPGSWPGASGRDHHDVLVVLGSGLSGAAERLGAGEDSPPARHPPLLPPYTAAGHRAQGWSVRIGGTAGPGLRRALPPATRASGRPRWSIPLRTGIAAGLLDRHPHRRRRRHPGRPGDRIDHGGRGPPEPDRAQPAQRPRVRRHGRRPTPRSCAHLALSTPARTGRSCRRVPASTPRCRARNSRRRPRSACCAPPERTWSACRWRSRRSPPATPAPRSSAWQWSPIRRPATAADRRHRRHRRHGHRRGAAVAGIVRHVVVSLP